MPYCVQNDILMILNPETLVVLADQGNPPSTVDASIVVWAIQAADDLINANLGGVFTVPFSTTPALIKDISVDIAIYNLFARRPEANMVPELYITRYKDRLKQLADLAAGKLGLVDLPASSSSLTTYKTNKTADSRIFTSDKLAGF